ncbi:hypothetical protein DFS33DRAFT_1278057 [Desarmillaria ectypa]|nr:hypothetical protein DFS33DRAFT_1278057 [Desarmillaria ectypa]
MFAPWPLLTLTLILLLHFLVAGGLINHTIDDTLGDQSTGVQMSDVICDFWMDGQVVGSYRHDTDGTYQFEYDVLAYSNASLSDEDHTFLIETTGMEPSYVVFDYAEQPSIYHVSDYTKLYVDYIRIFWNFKQLALRIITNAFLTGTFIFASVIVLELGENIWRCYCGGGLGSDHLRGVTILILSATRSRNESIRSSEAASWRLQAIYSGYRAVCSFSTRQPR